MAACKAASGEAIDGPRPVCIGKWASAALSAMCWLGMPVSNMDASKSATNNHHMGCMAKPLFRRFEFHKVVIAGHGCQQRSQFEGYGAPLDLSV